VTVAATASALWSRRYARSWFQRSTVTVARALVGCALVHDERVGMIVETEAYLGAGDRASHARFGVTERTSVMFGPGGVAYVYLCYGIHQMFNIVTDLEGRAGAVLVRAIAPLSRLPDDAAIGRGPGKVTRAMALDRRHNCVALDHESLFVARWRRPPAIAATARIGVDYAGAWAGRRLRFVWAGHPSVSGS
jgi:DNA-3-methyladenine glycosylase